MRKLITIILTSGVITSGCSSTYSNLVSGNNLGAKEYTPAVLVKSGNQGKYNQVLPLCRDVATKRQITAAQQAQLSTITGVAKESVDGALLGVTVGAALRDSGSGISRGDAALAGFAFGAISSATNSFASGTENTARETRRVLLSCLRKTSDNGKLWEVLE